MEGGSSSFAHAGQAGCEEFRYLADQFISLAQSEGQATSQSMGGIFQVSDGIGINRIAVDGIRSMPGIKGKTGITRRDRFDHKLKFLASVAEFRSAGDMHDVSGDKTGFFTD